MTALWWMIGASVIGWLGIILAGGAGAHPEALLGMIAPLASAVISWVVVARTHAAAPERVMGVMIAAFAAKMMFFGLYVAVMLRLLELRPGPFMASFTGFFIALYAMEALFLKRLFVDGPRASSHAESL